MKGKVATFSVVAENKGERFQNSAVKRLTNHAHDLFKPLKSWGNTYCRLVSEAEDMQTKGLEPVKNCGVPDY